MSEGMSLSQINLPTINMNNAEVAHNPNDKASGEEYFDRRGQQQEQEEYQQSPFIDRTAQLRATLNSLAALNAANVVQVKNKYKVKAINKDDEKRDSQNNENSKSENTENTENTENAKHQKPETTDDPITQRGNFNIES